MIELYKFGAKGPLCDPSPFCVKVEAYLRMADLPYKTHSGIQFLRSSPKDKLPYIKDDGATVSDSTFIIRHLEKKHNNALDGHLCDAEKAIAHGLTKMIDENLYWTVVHARWILDHNWLIMKEMFFGSLAFPLKLFIPNMIRKNVRKGMKKHGIGRHSDTEIAEIGSWDLKCLSDVLGDKNYFLGDRPSSLDAAAYGILSQMILSDTFTAPIFDKARTHQNLAAYTNRIHDKYFADYT
ncbi:MAG: glutathione S-transferase family protein [Emcibacter sp.]|nr:glutathione S-transferase family protein [Emcibacter sp.]